MCAPHRAHPEKVMIWGTIGDNFKGPLHIVDEGTVDWSSYRYEIIFGSELLDAADAAFGEFNWVLMQDSARPYICKAMIDLNQAQNQGISSRDELLSMWMDQKVNCTFTYFRGPIWPQEYRPADIREWLRS
jgi:hypothetical protein